MKSIWKQKTPNKYQVRRVRYHEWNTKHYLTIKSSNFSWLCQKAYYMNWWNYQRNNWHRTLSTIITLSLLLRSSGRTWKMLTMSISSKHVKFCKHNGKNGESSSGEVNLMHYLLNFSAFSMALRCQLLSLIHNFAKKHRRIIAKRIPVSVEEESWL